MGCRCKAICKCIFDIAEIERISLIIGFTEITDESVSTELADLASNGLSTFYSANEDELMTKEKKLNIDVTEKLSQLVVKCSNKIKDLQEELSSMQSEDSAYHAEEEEHHHHDD